MKRLLVVALLLMLANDALAENWRPYVKSNNGSVHYVDEDSIRVEGDRVKYWYRMDDNSTQLLFRNDTCPIARKTARMKILNAENCQTGETYFGIEMESYSSDGKRLVYPPSGPMKPTVSIKSKDTIGGILHKRICGNQ